MTSVACYSAERVLLWWREASRVERDVAGGREAQGSERGGPSQRGALRFDLEMICNLSVLQRRATESLWSSHRLSSSLSRAARVDRARRDELGRYIAVLNFLPPELAQTCPRSLNSTFLEFHLIRMAGQGCEQVLAPLVEKMSESSKSREAAKRRLVPQCGLPSSKRPLYDFCITPFSSPPPLHPPMQLSLFCREELRATLFFPPLPPHPP